MRIDEAARATGLSRDMIRHYEKLGLVRPARLENGYRDYALDEVYLLTVIKYLSNLGVPLRQIRQAFDSGQAGQIVTGLRGEIDRLERLKAQIDARVAAAEDSISCFRQFGDGVPTQVYSARPRYLLSFREDDSQMEASHRSATEHGGFFQFYYRQRFTLDGGVRPLGQADRGLLVYDALPGTEPVPAQRSLRVILTHPPGRILNERDLEPHLLEAGRMTRRTRFTALIHQLFLQKNAPDENVVCAEILLGTEAGQGMDK